MKPIHIAGTKGKGSTSAFISSILAQYLSSPAQPNPRLHKVGLYTSPHLRFVRERIQINNEPLSEEDFTKYFFQTWDRLEDAAQATGLPTDVSAKPGYFSFLTLMALHTYMSEGVDSAVIECGIGGEYDSTNILTSPTVTGITSLAIDHVAMLGNSIEQIAWHKAGIMKTGSPAFTAPQTRAALEVLQQRASSKSVILKVVEPDHTLSSIPLGLAADFQILNASLAVQIASAHLHVLGYPNSFSSDRLPAEFIAGLKTIRWPGRCEVRREKNIRWHIDGGHTIESIQECAKWFASEIPPSEPSSSQHRTRILLFNQQTRDANSLSTALYTTLAAALRDDHPFTHAVFCSNVTFRDTGFRPDLVSMNTDFKSLQDLTVQKGLAETWRAIDPAAQVEVMFSIEDAVAWVQDLAKSVDGEVVALVTGSLHLVGGFLEVLETRREKV